MLESNLLSINCIDRIPKPDSSTFILITQHSQNGRNMTSVIIRYTCWAFDTPRSENVATQTKEKKWLNLIRFDGIDIAHKGRRRNVTILLAIIQLKKVTANASTFLSRFRIQFCGKLEDSYFFVLILNYWAQIVNHFNSWCILFWFSVIRFGIFSGSVCDSFVDTNLQLNDYHSHLLTMFDGF